MGRLVRPAVLAAQLLALAACAESKPKQIVLPPPDPGQILVDKLETRLMRAKTVHVEAKLHSGGDAPVDLDESMWLGDGQRAAVHVTGTIRGQAVAGEFVCDGETMATKNAREKAAAEVRDNLAIGFVRLGLLHDAASIAKGARLEHVDGGIRDFVHLEEVRAGDPATRITFDEEFQGHGVLAHSTLVLDAEEKPRSRTSKVQLKDGVERDQTETYSAVEYDVPVADAQFAIPSPP